MILVDLVMRGMDGLALISSVKKEYPDVDVLVVTSFGETQRIHAALAAGATGYVLKDADVDEIYRAIVAARRGEMHLDPAVAHKLTESPAGPGALTPREREILVHLAHGRSNRAIATALGVTVRTVTMHLTNIFAKIGVVSRTQAALWAIREGLTTSHG